MSRSHPNPSSQRPELWHINTARSIVDGHYFGLDVLKVQEVIRYQEMTRVPLAPPTVRGLINLRGQIVTAIDLRRRLEFEDRLSTSCR